MSRLGYRWTVVAAAGLYVPGGTAAYPSSVLMNAVPAKVAGVPRVVMVVPAQDGKLNPLVLAAAKLAGVATQRDLLNMIDHGAVDSMSFSDAGLPSTTHTDTCIVPAAKGILAALSLSVVADQRHHLMAVAEQTAHDVGTHSAEADHSQLHCPLPTDGPRDSGE